MVDATPTTEKEVVDFIMKYPERKISIPPKIRRLVTVPILKEVLKKQGGRGPTVRIMNKDLPISVRQTGHNVTRFFENLGTNTGIYLIREGRKTFFSLTPEKVQKGKPKRKPTPRKKMKRRNGATLEHDIARCKKIREIYDEAKESQIPLSGITNKLLKSNKEYCYGLCSNRTIFYQQIRDFFKTNKKHLGLNLVFTGGRWWVQSDSLPTTTPIDPKKILESITSVATGSTLVTMLENVDNQLDIFIKELSDDLTKKELLLERIKKFKQDISAIKSL